MKKKLTEVLRKNIAVFIWSTAKMPWIDFDFFYVIAYLSTQKENLSSKGNESLLR